MYSSYPCEISLLLHASEYLLTHISIFILASCLQTYPEQDGKTDGTETTSNLNQKLFFHRLGWDQKDDVLVAETPEHPKWMM